VSLTLIEKLLAISAFANVFLAFTVRGVERATRRRLDIQSLRLAEIEHHVGMAPLFPLDVECPICNAEVRTPCRGSGKSSHSARFDASPGYERARIMQRIDQAIERRMRP